MLRRICASTAKPAIKHTWMSCWTRRWRNHSPPATPRQWADLTSRKHGAPFVRHEKIVHVIRVLLFHDQNAFEHGSRTRILIAEIADQLTVVIHRNSFRYQIFLDHLDEIAGGAEFGGSA